MAGNYYGEAGSSLPFLTQRTKPLVDIKWEPAFYLYDQPAIFRMSRAIQISIGGGYETPPQSKCPFSSQREPCFWSPKRRPLFIGNLLPSHDSSMDSHPSSFRPPPFSFPLLIFPLLRTSVRFTGRPLRVWVMFFWCLAKVIFITPPHRTPSQTGPSFCPP